MVLIDDFAIDFHFEDGGDHAIGGGGPDAHFVEGEVDFADAFYVGAVAFAEVGLEHHAFLDGVAVFAEAIPDDFAVEFSGAFGEEAEVAADVDCQYGDVFGGEVAGGGEGGAVAAEDDGEVDFGAGGGEEDRVGVVMGS